MEGAVGTGDGVVAMKSNEGGGRGAVLDYCTCTLVESCEAQ